jgi:GT2 family glycosyltransferase
MIGIAITTHNRRDTALETVAKWKAMLPDGAQLIVVDDASNDPYPDADHRFNVNVGIAKAKNKCIELLIDKGCDQLFLADDDCYPTWPDWWKAYIESPHPLLSYTFSIVGKRIHNGNHLIKKDADHKYYSNPCGCMMYINKIVVDAIGGYDVQYALYGDEHLDYAYRAKNAGLIPHPFMDVMNPLFYCLDEAGSYRTSRLDVAAQSYLSHRRLNQQKNLNAFMPYQEVKNKLQKPYVLSSYFNYANDPQRRVKMPNSIDPLLPLVNSCNALGVRLVILTNCDFQNQGTTEFVKINKPDNDFTPNDFRWLMQLDYIQKNRTTYVWCVDATDVEVLRNPFEIDSDVLYVGYEKSQTLASTWLWQSQWRFCKNPSYSKLIRTSKHLTLLNCGVVGGEYSIALRFFQLMANETYFNAKKTLRAMDMASFNYVVYSHFADCFVTGSDVVSEFKAYESNSLAMFKHK